MRADSTQLSWFVGIRFNKMGKRLAHKGHVSRDVPEPEQPGLVPRAKCQIPEPSLIIFNNLLAIGEAKTVAQDQGVSRAHVLLSNRALADTVTRL